MKAETYPKHQSRGWQKLSSLLKKLVTQQVCFSSFILYPLSLNRLYRVLSTAILGIFCCLFLVTGLPASAAEMPEIQRRGYFTIAVKDNLPPLGFRDGNGNIQGLEIDLAQRLATDLLGKAEAVKLQPVANRDRLSVVLKQKVDLTIARVTATESRSRLVSFSVPYYLDGTYLITKDNTVKELRDLAKRKIAVLNHSDAIAQVRYYVPNAELVGVNSYQEGREQLESNAATAFAADASVLSGWIQQYPQYRLLPTKLSTEPLSVVMPKGLQYDELRRKVNEAIARYTVEGWLKQRAQYWGLP
ncbi:glutamine ABC transporter, glutamine-binding protein GlnH [Anabaenopsis circularis NIES-21]|uniref:Glutamine ABC transporter, glutamine-binding protein GlnH n=2 Tax=Nostocales TaxID=1161 RepID=A0A1Z4GQI6_9CYAN|nr:transporter substrate-binding domain-containing protein [Nostoc cycadae]BAY19576.1 glutamine ABC transporter, glutamine-binding protein GlnH [Anabaenopsis circularis NIES-21]GBE95571.1 amino acid ABC transporter substrate-binding protein [Nostoc cycadae WK-1]